MTKIMCVYIVLALLFAILVIIKVSNKTKKDLKKKSKERIRHLQPDGLRPDFYGIYLSNKTGYSHKRTNKRWTKKN